MASIVLFHHVLGLTPGVRAFATRLRARGHTVVTPDLFAGRRFDTIDEGIARASSVGFDAVADRGADAVAALPGPIVTIGMSMGVMAATATAERRSDVKAVVMLHAAIPPEFLGPRWPAGLPVQIHLNEGDPFVDEDLPAANALVSAVGAELNLYEVEGHLTTDATCHEYDEATTLQVVDNIDHWLSER